MNWFKRRRCVFITRSVPGQTAVEYVLAALVIGAVALTCMCSVVGDMGFLPAVLDSFFYAY